MSGLRDSCGSEVSHILPLACLSYRYINLRGHTATARSKIKLKLTVNICLVKKWAMSLSISMATSVSFCILRIWMSWSSVTERLVSCQTVSFRDAAVWVRTGPRSSVRKQNVTICRWLLVGPQEQTPRWGKGCCSGLVVEEGCWGSWWCRWRHMWVRRSVVLCQNVFPRWYVFPRTSALSIRSVWNKTNPVINTTSCLILPRHGTEIRVSHSFF